GDGDPAALGDRTDGRYHRSDRGDGALRRRVGGRRYVGASCRGDRCRHGGRRCAAAPDRQPGVISTRTTAPSTVSPAATEIFATSPSTSAVSVVSIFMASITTTG